MPQIYTVRTAIQVRTDKRYGTLTNGSIVIYN